MFDVNKISSCHYLATDGEEELQISLDVGLSGERWLVYTNSWSIPFKDEESMHDFVREYFDAKN